jgi:misacylated tRNA(Ala) deacylase
MTELIYQIDAYQKECDARVIELDPDNLGIVMDRTVFYPGGGGQPHDTGTLTCGSQVFPVTRVKKTGDLAFHYVDGNETLPAVGDPIHGSIDWERRYQLMRTHTALHVLCGVVFRDYGALVTGGDMETLQGRMDFEFETMQKELVMEIEAAVNLEIGRAHHLRVEILPRAQAFQIPDLIRTKINLLPEGIQKVRVVEIVGLDLQADGELKTTPTVGRIG